MLTIKDLEVSIENSPILKHFSLEVKPGEIHAIMGPNGAGKSTLAKVLAGHPSYEVSSGEIEFLEKDLLELEPDERSHAGLFMGFQYPIEIPGVTNRLFLKTALNLKRKNEGKDPLNDEQFDQVAQEALKEIGIRPEFMDRNVNEGFSGGEKKRNEILQMAILKPKLAILDETDSGLDIDALKAVADGVNKLMNPEMGLVIITHYQRLLNYIKPDFVHVMIDGKIVQSGDSSLALELESKGYDWITPDREGAAQ